MNQKTQKKTIGESTKTDFKVSFTMLRENYKAFIATELFAIVAFLITYMVLFSILSLIYIILPNLSVSDLFVSIKQNYNSSRLFVALITLLSYIVLVGFLNCQYGLAYDIFSSGDMFAEFKSSFSYFRKHWWKYVLLTFIMGISMFIPDRRFIHPVKITSITSVEITLVITLRILQFVLSWVFLVIFSITLPSVTAQGSFTKSFAESFKILKENPKRLITTWGVYFLVFQLPLLVFSLLTISLTVAGVDIILIRIMLVFVVLSYLVIIFIGMPMRALLTTRIYNSLIFTDIQKTEGETEKERNYEQE
ncbi:MAG: hypothetical protein ACTSRR_12780 [Candidatus Heimdallarchaeaceae archaeon]